MKTTHRNAGWTTEWVQQIAENLKRERGRAGHTLKELGDYTKALGRPIGWQTIANIEQGVKRSPGVDEIAVLALALGIPQSHLLYADQFETVPVAPGVDMPPRAALQRFVSGLSLVEALNRG